MGVHYKNARNELPEKICEFCSQKDYYYEGYDRDNGVADTCVTYCASEADHCPFKDIYWEELIKAIKETNFECLS